MEHLSKKKVGAYLAKFNTQHRIHLQFILENTRFIPTSELLDNLRRILSEYKIRAAEHKQETFYLYDNGYKWGSENWLAVEFYELLGKPIVVHEKDLSLLPKGSRLLIIDDCIYSGGNIGRSIDDIVGGTGGNVHTDIIVGYSTKNGMDYVIKQSKNCLSSSVKVGEMIPSIVDVVFQLMYDMDWTFFNDICCTCDSYNKPVDRPFEHIALVWFEYKLACFNSTIRGILENVIDEPDRSIVSKSAEKKDIFVRFR